MTSTAEKLFDEAMTLPEDERRRLGERILESVPQETREEFERVLRDVVMRRVEAVRRGESKLVPWSEVKKSLREALGE